MALQDPPVGRHQCTGRHDHTVTDRQPIGGDRLELRRAGVIAQSLRLAHGPRDRRIDVRGGPRQCPLLPPPDRQQQCDQHRDRIEIHRAAACGQRERAGAQRGSQPESDRHVHPDLARAQLAERRAPQRRPAKQHDRHRQHRLGHEQQLLQHRTDLAGACQVGGHRQHHYLDHRQPGNRYAQHLDLLRSPLAVRFCVRHDPIAATLDHGLQRRQPDPVAVVHDRRPPRYEVDVGHRNTERRAQPGLDQNRTGAAHHPANLDLAACRLPRGCRTLPRRLCIGRPAETGTGQSDLFGDEGATGAAERLRAARDLAPHNPDRRERLRTVCTVDISRSETDSKLWFAPRACPSILPSGPGRGGGSHPRPWLSRLARSSVGGTSIQPLISVKGRVRSA